MRQSKSKILLTAAVAAFGLAAGTSGASAALAVRCGPNNCDYVECHDNGNHCRRLDRPDFLSGHPWRAQGSYYQPARFTLAGWREDDEDRYDGDDGRYDGRYYEGGYYRDGDWRHELHLVCDSDGDRCYRTHDRWWNYREYYRRHGYHWDDGDHWHGGDRDYDRDGHWE
jgi:hypothetical protein